MTTPSIDPSLPPMLALTGGEREVLEAFLDFHRAMVTRKALGLSDQDIRRRHVPSLTTLGGLLKHLTIVERNWFRRVLAQDPTMGPPTQEDADGSFMLDAEDTLDTLVAAYGEACAESRRIAAEFPLDHVVPHAELGQVSLCWIYVHMIEETARHAGHADILRELTDGVTGAVV
ncbi:DinB family protein [Sphaerimonospora cavernae]|uniref:DinB family protein n=1 Tax=Sphaerimonospora cavernae TaxID=1740611 RepID=A0ABV6U728_9ACTN